MAWEAVSELTVLERHQAGGKELMDEQALKYSHLPMGGGERQCQACVAWLVGPFCLKILDRAPHSQSRLQDYL